MALMPYEASLFTPSCPMDLCFRRAVVACNFHYDLAKPELDSKRTLCLLLCQPLIRELLAKYCKKCVIYLCSQRREFDVVSRYQLLEIRPDSPNAGGGKRAIGGHSSVHV
ncbi:hypothetical protein N7451_012212 [Penicillium sp. IBT 35674x]|nr:hypothetical protein N7451_012212 [Penicillium sp. IBT 35674x]